MSSFSTAQDNNLHHNSAMTGNTITNRTPAANGTSNAGTSNAGTSNVEVLKDNAAAAYNSVANGPVAQNVKDQHAKTSAEFSNLANARQTPADPAATGQPLTHYHSFFSELLSWNNPRASAIAFASIVAFIFAVRYLDVLRWGFKLTWMVLGITIAAEVAGKTLMNNGLATQLRPRKYYTVPRETLDSMIGDVHELVNFFVIESQRILFAENVYASAAAALGAFLSYYLVKIVPYWGLGLIATTTLFFVPLIYTSNQELIDHHIGHASNVVNAQTAQIRDVAQRHTAQAADITKQYVGDYTAKAQEMIRGGKAQEPVHSISSNTTGSRAVSSSTLGNNTFGDSALGSHTTGSRAVSGSTFGDNALGSHTLGNHTAGSRAVSGSTFGDTTLGSHTLGDNPVGSRAVSGTTLGSKEYTSTDFPLAPKDSFKIGDPVLGTKTETEPFITS